jgi:hypothetical protein
MFSSRFAKLVTDNKSAWKAGLAVVVAGATFKVTRTERWWGRLALLRSFSYNYYSQYGVVRFDFILGRVLQFFSWPDGRQHGEEASAGDGTLERCERIRFENGEDERGERPIVDSRAERAVARISQADESDGT